MRKLNPDQNIVFNYLISLSKFRTKPIIFPIQLISEVFNDISTALPSEVDYAYNNLDELQESELLFEYSKWCIKRLGGGSN